MESIGNLPANTADRYTVADCQQLRRAQDAGGIVFQAHPLLHGLSWTVPDSVANRHVLLAIKKQAFRRCKGSGYSLRPTLQGLRVAAQESAWQYAALQQTPRAVWDHGRVLTDYQVWVVYRVAVRQLNLYHAERTRDNSCRKLQCCRGIKETADHIFWTCPCAQACWQKLICHWTRE